MRVDCRLGTIILQVAYNDAAKTTRCFARASWIGAVDLNAVDLRKAHEGQDCVFGLVYHSGEFGKLGAQLVSHSATLRAGRFHAFLHEDGVDHGQDGLTLAFADVNQDVVDEMHTAVLPARFEDLAGGRLESFVGVRNDQRHIT